MSDNSERRSGRSPILLKSGAVKMTITEFANYRRGLEESAAAMGIEITGLPIVTWTEPARVDRRMFSKGELRGWLKARADQMKPGDLVGRREIYEIAGWGNDGAAYLLLGHDTVRGLHGWLGRRATEAGLVAVSNSTAYSKPEPTRIA